MFKQALQWHSVVQVRTASCGATACVNTFGDEQLAVDLLADKLLFEALKFSVRHSASSQAHTLSLDDWPQTLRIQMQKPL